MKPRPFYRFVSGLVRGQMALSIAALGLIVLINLYEILMRTVFNKSLLWIQDVSVLFMVWMIFCGFTAIVYRKKDITIDLLVNLLPGGVNKILRLFTHVLMLAFLAVFTWVGYFYLVRQTGVGTLTAEIPRVLYIFPVILNSFSVMLVYLLEIVYLLVPRLAPGGEAL